jgi:hypothetical protein
LRFLAADNPLSNASDDNPVGLGKEPFSECTSPTLLRALRDFAEASKTSCGLASEITPRAVQFFGAKGMKGGGKSKVVKNSAISVLA